MSMLLGTIPSVYKVSMSLGSIPSVYKVFMLLGTISSVYLSTPEESWSLPKVFITKNITD